MSGMYVTMSEEMLERLRQQSDDDDRSVSQLVRRAVKASWERTGAPAAVLELVHERSLRRCYETFVYPTLPWEGASPDGRKEAEAQVRAEDVRAVVESMLVSGELVHITPTGSER